MDGNQTCRARLRADLDVSFPNVLVRKGKTIANVRTFRHALDNLRPDVLVTSNWGSIEWAIANALPVTRHVHTEDGFGPEENEGQITRRVVLRRLFLRRSTVVLPSRTLLSIATQVWRLPPARLRYIPNGVDLDRFTRRPDESATLQPGKQPVIGSVGVLRGEKNFGRLLRAFRLARDSLPARLVIVGDGPERPRLEALAHALGLTGSVRFTGQVSDPTPLYHSFDLFALGSDTEQMPFSVIEAMAAGLPVAATDVGDIRPMLSAENRPYVSGCNHVSLAESLRALLHAPGLRSRIGAANRAKAVQEYDQEKMFLSYAALLDASSAEQTRHD